MPSPDLRSIRNFDTLIRYLEDELDWPLKGYSTEDLTFEYDASELGIDPKAAARIKEIKQLRPLAGSQPWGIFFVNFEKKRLPVVVLRKLLRVLVLKKRSSSNQAERKAWQPRDLLFISSYGEEASRTLSFAHFVENEGNALAELRVLGWDDDDTPLHMDYVHGVLCQKLRWDDRLSDAPEQWRQQWSEAFVLRHRHVIQKSDELAAALAQLARRIQNRIRTLLASEDDSGEMRKLQASFKSGLIHDLNDESFADMFAQTVTYGLFSLACRRTVPGGGTAFAKDELPHYFTSPFLKEMLGVFLGLKSRKGAIDFDELGVSDVTDLLTSPDTHMEVVLADFNNKTRGEDPVIHFYEHFLSAYNKKLKVQRGVFYTPQAVVSYIVRSVHELLQTEFGLEDGLASTATWGEMIQKNPSLKLPLKVEGNPSQGTISESEPFVQILDPATGTATFLVETIEVIHRTLKAKWQSQRLSAAQQRDAWNEYVPNHLLPRLHGYELMMAPYAIAHMKIGLKLTELGYNFASGARANIYLTNALEPWVKQLPLIGFDALAHEAAAVNEIKRHKRFTVVIGNPPYSNFGMLNKIPFILGLLEDYKRGLDEKKLNLDDDFIKFVRFSQRLLDTTGAGVFGMITNNSFVDGITHRQMRQSLMGSFNLLHVLNLHGSSKKKEKAPDGSEDENVFDIQQGVATTLAVASTKRQAAEVFTKDLWGKRETKYAALDAASISASKWERPKLAAPYFFFTDKNLDDGAEYKDCLGLKAIFIVSGNGVKTERDGVSIHFTKEEIESSVRDFQSLDEPTLRRKYETGDDSRDWTVKKAKADAIAHKGQPLYRRLLYRPFDIRHTWYSGQTRGFMGTPAFPTMKHMHKGNVAMVTTRQTAEKFDLLCTDNLVGHKSVAGYDINTAFPLYVFEEALSFDLGERHAGSSHGIQKRPNLSGQFLKALAAALQLPQKGEHGLPAGLTPEDIFHYAYAVFNSPGYRSRYAEFLKIDFPRLPLTGDIALFRSLARLGGELTALHLLESPKLAQPITEFIGTSREVTKVGYSGGTVWINATGTKGKTTGGTSGFRGVPEAVWNFHIGGYQVCEKWLDDRRKAKRSLSDEDIAHYHKMVIALTETIRLMAEIDEVIEQHGGWPGAFQTGGSTATVLPDVQPQAARPTAHPPQAHSNAFVPGELFATEGELTPAKKAPAAREAAKQVDKSARAPLPNRQAIPIDQTERADVLATIREVFATGGERDRDTALKEIATALGYERLGPHIREVLSTDIRTAVRRGILQNHGGQLSLSTRAIGDYDRAELKKLFLAAIHQNGRIWHTRDDAIRRFTRWLGFRRTGSLIEESARSLINGLLRDGSLEKNGPDEIRRT